MFIENVNIKGGSMKRILFVALFLCFVAVQVVSASDFVFTQPEGLDWETYVSDNTTGYYKTTNVDITTIIPKGIGQNRVLGFTVMSLTGHGGVTGGSEAVASLWDQVSGGTASILGEAEALDESFDGMWFAIPKILKNGLTIRQGANTRVIVYYE